MSKRPPKTVAKSTFKAQALQYLREVETSGKELVITDHGRPVLKVVPYAEDPAAALESLRGSVLRYDDPLEPVGSEDWEASR
jgi:prevent-host-death family protein